MYFSQKASQPFAGPHFHRKHNMILMAKFFRYRRRYTGLVLLTVIALAAVSFLGSWSFLGGADLAVDEITSADQLANLVPSQKLPAGTGNAMNPDLSTWENARFVPNSASPFRRQRWPQEGTSAYSFGFTVYYPNR